MFLSSQDWPEVSRSGICRQLGRAESYVETSNLWISLTQIAIPRVLTYFVTPAVWT